ncbi:hypothetical protein MCAP1_001743 [Malassezia caprae]|uniref:Chromosome transmission fidelity protein 8 n=1 Tax=Malassezia caprae TaxID=1381934 RepID=A0AAF0E742_9BASI|nr:hypothetical protein MCAP1_001743 [Malassezia caprae]
MRIPIYTGRAPGHVPRDDLPPPLVRLSPDGELVLVELQGSLEMDGCDVHGGHVLGTLTFPTGRENQPVLQISHHRLEGTFVKLRRPLAVMMKQTHAPPASPSSPTPLASPPSSPPASPTLARKRARTSESDAAPVRARPVPPSSSPMPPPPVRWSDGHMDFSSPNVRATGARRPPTTSYTVVTLVRQKLLFSKRPEPVVKLAKADTL